MKTLDGIGIRHWMVSLAAQIHMAIHFEQPELANGAPLI
jgi:hypothetical protein